MTKLSPFVPKDRVIIGRVGGPHGVRGELRIIPLTDFPERFSDMHNVMVGSDRLHIESIRPQGRNILMRFREYPTREEAQQLTGRLLTVAREEAVPLDDGEYYVFDIVGLTVYDEMDNEIGTIDNVLHTGSNDVYVVRTEEGGELLVPALRTVVCAIDLADGRMTVRLPE